MTKREKVWAEWERAWAEYQEAVKAKDWAKADSMRTRILQAANACDRMEKNGGRGQGE